MMMDMEQLELKKASYETIGNLNLSKYTDGFKSRSTDEAFPYLQKREINQLPPSAKFIIYLLKMKGTLNRKEIIQNTLMPDRTVGFALKLLKEKSLIEIVDPRTLIPALSQRRKRRIKPDRRITNYKLVTTVVPYLMGNV
ncbi:MAG: hypothetical protein LUQ65_00070 [Candidatus Helarchaeota archaeon]|nr:hypothetical protein [Candidatus Helarchaeota archaeon]